LAEFQPVFISSFAWWSLVYWTILIASSAWDYYRRYQEGAIKSSQLEAQLAHSQLQALKMQLQPHFLFNTLHSISALLNEDPEQAERMIARLGDFLRMTLHDTAEHQTTLQQELQFLQCYLEIEHLRFQDRLSTAIEVEPDLMSARVPYLILQPIVENAIRHGITPQATAGRIEIFAHRHQDRLQFRVIDNGPGLALDRRNSSGLGLANTRARLQQLYGNDFSLDLDSPAHGGFVVEIDIPLRI